MDLSWLVDLRTRGGDPLLFFGPLSVTETLPHGTSDDVRAEVRRAMDLCRDRASLVFFTSNTITPVKTTTLEMTNNGSIYSVSPFSHPD